MRIEEFFSQFEGERNRREKIKQRYPSTDKAMKWANATADLAGEYDCVLLILEMLTEHGQNLEKQDILRLIGYILKTSNENGLRNKVV